MKYLLQAGLAVLSAFVASLAILLIQVWPNTTAYFTIIFLGLVLLVLISLIRPKSEWGYNTLPITAIFFLGCVFLSSIAEWKLLRYFLILFSGFVEAWLTWVKHPPESFTPYQHKIIRRVITMLYVFFSYSLITFLFALMILYGLIPVWISTLAGAAGCVISTFYIWKMYYDISFQNVLIWLFVIGIMMVEIIWSIYELPFDFGSAGLFATWIWYIMQLLVRFHLSPQKIVWRRQKWSLALHAAIFVVLLLFFVRWV